MGSAGAMLAFSRAFHDEKERKLQEAGARFASTGAHPAFKYPVVDAVAQGSLQKESCCVCLITLLCFCRHFSAGRAAGGAGRGGSARCCTAGADLRLCLGAGR